MKQEIFEAAVELSLAQQMPFQAAVELIENLTQFDNSCVRAAKAGEDLHKLWIRLQAGNSRKKSVGGKRY